MSLRCLPSSLCSICIAVWEEMPFEEFQNGCCGSHLGCQNGTNLAVLNLMSPQCLPPSCSLIRLIIPKQMSFQNFQAGHHGGHLGYWNGKNLATLNLHVTLIPPNKFGLNPTYCSGADMLWRISRWPLWLPSWISELNKFSNSESLCCFNASHQVLANSHYNCLGDVLWRFSRWPTSWISEWNDFSNSKSPCGPNASHQVWAQSDLGLGADVISRFSRWPPSWIAEWNDLSNSESLCSSVLSIKFWFNPTYGLGGDVVDASHQVSANSDLLFGRRWFSRWPPWISEQKDFRNSESLYPSDASHQVSAQSELLFRRRRYLKNFKMTAMMAILDIRTERF